MKKVNYKKLYTDIIYDLAPDKFSLCEDILNKKTLSSLDIITLNNIIFGSKSKINQKFRSYSKKDILYILEFQLHNNLSNYSTAKYFNMSRNTLAKWKKQFLTN